MNHVYKVVFCKASGTFVAVAEYAKAQGKKSVGSVVKTSSSKSKPYRFAYSLLTASVLLASNAAFAVTDSGTGSNIVLNPTTPTSPNTVVSGSLGSANVVVGDKNNLTLPNGSMQNIIIGYNNNINATNSVSNTTNQIVNMGNNNKVSGVQSVALGSDMTITGPSSIAIGGDDLDAASNLNINGTAGTGTGDTGSFGQVNKGTIATTYKSYTGVPMVETKDLDNSGSIANEQYIRTTSGVAAVAVGVQSKATGGLSTAVGTTSTASGLASTALGVGSKATGEVSLAIGAASQAQGTSSIAQGTSSKAFSNYSIAIGNGASVPVNNVANQESINSVAIGNNAKVVTGNGVPAIGTNGTLGGATAVGHNAQTAYGASVAIGAARANAINSIAIGAWGGNDGAFGAVTEADGAFAVGNSATVAKQQSIGGQAIGRNSAVYGAGGQAYGQGAQANGLGSIAIGGGFEPSTGISVPGGVTAARVGTALRTPAGALLATPGTGAMGALAIGQTAGVAGGADFGVALGSNSNIGLANAKSGIAIGNQSNVNSNNGIAIGKQTVTAASANGGNVAIGNTSIALGNTSTAIGSGAYAGDISLQAQIKAQTAIIESNQQLINSNPSSTSVGTWQTNIDNAQATIAALSSSNINNGIAIGTSAQALGNQSISIGTGNIVTGNNSGTLGDPSINNGTASYTFGNDNAIGSTTTGAFILGNNNQSGATATYDATTGKLISASGLVDTAPATNSAAIGNRNAINSQSTYVLGSGINTAGSETNLQLLNGTVANSVYLGDDSSATRGAGSVDATGNGTLRNQLINSSDVGTTTTAGATGTVTNATINGTTYGNFAGQTAIGAIAVGASGSERRIQNVAAGEISKTSTDAINGSQLYMVATQASNPLTFKGNTNADTDTIQATTDVNGDGIIDANDLLYKAGDGTQRQLGQTLNIIGSTTPVATVVDNSGSATQGAYTAKNIQTVVTDGQVQIQMADNPEFTTIKLSDATNNTTLSSTANGLDVGGDKITNVANGINPNDAVNFSQLTTTNQNVAINTANIAKGTVYAGDTTTGATNAFTRQLGEQTNIIGGATGALTDNNIGVVSNGSDTLTVKLAKDINLGADGSVTTGNTVVNNAGITITGGANPVSLTNTGLNNGGNTITNVLAGVNPTDAVNVSQLNAVAANAKTTTVLKGTNIASVTSNTVGNNTEYTINANGTTASAGSTAVTVKAGTPDANNVTDYQVDLSQSSKDSLAKADTALQTVVTQIDGKDIKTINQTNNTANFVTGDNMVLSDDGNGGIKIATAKDVNFSSVTTSGLTVTPNSTVNMGGNVVSNMGSGLQGKTLEQIKAEGNTSPQWNNGATIGDLTTVQSNVNNVQQIVGGVDIDGNVVDGNGNSLTIINANNTQTPVTLTASDALRTYDAAGIGTVETNSVLTAIKNINEQGTKYIHFNGGERSVGGKRGSNDEQSQANGSMSTAIGYQTIANGDGAVAIGNVADANGTNSIAIGTKAQAIGEQSIAIGTGNVVTGNNSGAIGDPNTVSGNASYAYGNDNTILSDNSFAIANNASIATNAAGAVALGNKTSVTVAGGVALGENSLANRAGLGATVTTTSGTADPTQNQVYALPQSTDADKTAIIATAQNSAGAVSIGRDGANRQITHVAAGSADSDAVNVAQLKAAANTAAAAAAAAKTTVTQGAGIAVTPTTNADGSTTYNVATKTDGTTITTDTNGNITAVTSPLTNTVTGSINTPASANALATAGDVANVVNNSGFNLTAQGANGSLVKPGSTVNMQNTDGNIVVSKSATDNTVNYDLAKNIKVDSVAINNSTVALNNTGLNNGGNTITNVAAGVNGTDAVNVNQLNAMGNNVNNALNQMGYKINDVEQNANAGISGAMAMAALPQAYIPGKSMLAGGMATYNGEGAAAVGISKLSDNGRWVIKVNGTADTQGNFGGAVGAGFHW